MSYIGNEPIVSATRTVTEITATAGQTTFTANGGYTVGFIDVFVNGALQQSTDLTATNGTSITLISPASAGDDIRLVAYGTFQAANTYTAANIDSKIGAAQFGFKNRIINGAMMIDQRNAGASVTVNDAQVYTLDRFRAQDATDGAFTVQQVSDAPTGFINSAKITTTTADSSLGATQFAILTQFIEGTNVADLAWGTANAATVTLSFWVKSSLTGTFGGALLNSAVNRSYPYSYTINSANTWEQKTITIAGDTSGTWLTTTGTGLAVHWGLGIGSTYSGTANTWAGSLYFAPTGATSVIGTLNATWQVTGVQLEKGSTATSFDYRPYGTELALCQRYCYVPLTNQAYYYLGMGRNTSTTQTQLTIQLPVSMRSVPSLISSANSVMDAITGATGSLSMTSDGSANNNAGVLLNYTSGTVTGGSFAFMRMNGTTSTYQFSAEL